MNQKIVDLFYENRNMEQAKKMAVYMKDNFPFLGIQKPIRMQLQKKFIKEAKKNIVIDWNFIFILWNLPEREFQYLAIDYLIALKNSLKKGDITKIEKLITEKSWWDSVDLLSAHLIGTVCMKYPTLIKSHILKWAEGENIWLLRTGILFQLKYKENTDTALLSSIIIKHSYSKEFFIKKAIGWALREYSKTNPQWVKLFTESNSLQPLSLREGTKYL